MCPSEANELEMESLSLYAHILTGKPAGSELGLCESPCTPTRVPVMALRGPHS